MNVPMCCWREGHVGLFARDYSDLQICYTVPKIENSTKILCVEGNTIVLSENVTLLDETLPSSSISLHHTGA